MPLSACEACNTARAAILRPKNHGKLCRACFIAAFEDEIHTTITTHALFRPGERVAIGASGGKDSTVLASVLKTLNERHGYGLDLVLLSIDEGITGYRDDSLETVKRNSVQYDMDLCILGYKELYGWTMDEVVGQVGKKGNCTYCGVFRRQALDRGAARLGVNHVVTGHNADDVAETVLMNLLRGDLPRLSRATSIITESASSPIKRSKPLKYAYEKEIVLYAHHNKLEYFSTECIYSPEAFRGSARTLVKNLEKIRPSAILDLVRSGEDMARYVPSTVAASTGKNGAAQKKNAVVADHFEDDEQGGCGSANGRSSGGEMAEAERRLRQNAEAEENEVEFTTSKPSTDMPTPALGKTTAPNSASQKEPAKAAPLQQVGQCERCGYMSSQAICKACMLLEGLNKNRPQRQIDHNHSQASGLAASPQRIQLADGND